MFDFADGGAEDERTLRRNEAAFDDYDFLPRPLNGAADARSLGRALRAQRCRMPVIIGPTGLSGLFWPGRRACGARARRRAAGTAFCLSHGSVCTLEDLAATGASPRWMQVFVYRDRGFTRELAERAKAAGYDALVLTIDNQLLGNRERDIRNGFTIPPRFGARRDRRDGAEGRLALAHAQRAEAHHLRQLRPPRRDGASCKTLGAAHGRAARPVHVLGATSTELRRVWNGPLILKGVLHPDEARDARRRAASTALIVSNHGGRQLDGAHRDARRAARHRRCGRRPHRRCSSTAACGAAATS